MAKTESPREAVSILKGGGLVVLPTDTVYGLSAALFNREGYERLNQLKGYQEARHFLHIAGSIDMVERVIESWGCTSRQVMQKIWPAPLSAIFRSAPACPPWVGGTIALRVPDDRWLRTLIDDVGEPLLSTSVNTGGGPPLTRADEIEEQFGEKVELMIVDDTVDDTRPSTLVDFTGESPRIVRHGRYAWPTAGKPSK